MFNSNMIKLATYLEEHVTQEQFDMSSYRVDEDMDIVNLTSSSDLNNTDECGTFGCALGWGPWVDGLRLAPVDFDVIGNVMWTDYCKRILDEIGRAS